MNTSLFQLELCGIQHSALLLALLSHQLLPILFFCNSPGKSLDIKPKIKVAYILTKRFIKTVQTSEMPRQVEVLVSKAEDLSLVPRTSQWEGEN